MTSSKKIDDLRRAVDVKIKHGSYLNHVMPSPTSITGSGVTADRQSEDDEPDLHRNAPRPDQACLYGLIGRIAVAAVTTEANLYAVALNALIYLSAGVGRGPYMSIGNTIHHSNLYALHIGRSGRGRKGDAASLVHRIDRIIHERQVPEAVQVWRSGLSSREGLVKLIHDGYAEGKNEVEPIHDKRLCVFESEFVNVLHQSRREGNTLSAALRDAWDGVSIKPAIKGPGIGVTDPHISLMGAITPSELRVRLAARELTNGFANRFMMIFAERERMVPFPDAAPDGVVTGLADEVAAVFRLAGANRWVDCNTRQIRLTPGARELYEYLYCTELNVDVGGPVIAPLLERRAPVLLRIAMVLALTDHVMEIDVQHIRAAHAWVRYWTETTLFVFSEAADEESSREISETAQRIVDFIKTRGNVTRKQITKELFKGHVRRDKIDAALDELLGSSPPQVAVETIQGGGRPAKHYSMAANEANLQKNTQFVEPQGIAHRGINSPGANYAAKPVQQGHNEDHRSRTEAACSPDQLQGNSLIQNDISESSLESHHSQVEAGSAADEDYTEI